MQADNQHDDDSENAHKSTIGFDHIASSSSTK